MSILASDTEEITCLSIQQPYAAAVFFDGKWCENRSWATNYTGELWIHASKIDQEIVSEALSLDVDLNDVWPDRLRTGAILGRVQMLGCFSGDDLFAAATLEACDVMQENPKNRPPVTQENRKTVELIQKMLHGVNPATWSHFTRSRYAWIFGDPEYLENPIEMPGSLSLWKAKVPSSSLVLIDWGDGSDSSSGIPDSN